MREGQILVTKTVLPEMDEYIEEIKDLWESRWITNMLSLIHI